MKTLILTGLIILSSCGKQVEKNYYGNQAANTSLDQEEVTYTYNNRREALTTAPEFSFPVSLVEEKNELPSETSPQFFNVFQRRNKELKTLNYEIYEKGTRELTILGKHIILDKEDTQQILSLMNGALDLSKLTIEADILEVSTAVKIPQTHLIINARELVINEGGSFNTTPKSLPYPAEIFKDGAHGLTGGQIEFYISIFTNNQNPKTPVFLANGGNGQQAGAGQDGSKGHNALIAVQPNYIKVAEKKCARDHHHGADRHKLFVFNKRSRRSGNGQDAKVGGMPGGPGMPGKIYTNYPYVYISRNLRGKPGRQDRVRIGGSPGTPEMTCILERRCAKKDRSVKCVTATKGKDAQPKRFTGKTEEIDVGGGKSVSWITDSIIKYNLAYLEELYFRGFIEQAILEKYKIESMFASEKNLSPSQMLVMNKLQQLEYQMAARLDYFGNPAGWTPNFSFHLNFRAFKNEVKRALQILFYTELLQEKLKANQSIVNSTKSFQKELMNDVSDSENQLIELRHDIEKLIKSLSDLQVAREEFEFELKKIEDQIKREAKNNLKTPMLTKAVKIFAAASKVIPVAQPALALVGQGIEMVHNASTSKKPLEHLLDNVPNYMDSLNGVDFRKAGEELSGKLNELSLKKLSEFSKAPENETNEQRIDRLRGDFEKKKKLVGEMIDFYGPVVESVKKQTEMMRSREVSKSALDAEIAKIKRKHKRFKKVSKLLEKLQIKQEETNLLLKKTNTQVSTNFQKITENILLVSDLYTELGNASKIQSAKLDSLLSEYKKRAVRNLRYYHYKLAKSYAYKTLKPLKTKLELDRVYEATMSLVKTGKEKLDSGDLNYAYLAYENELSKITDDVISDIELSKTPRQLRKNLYLSQIEVEELNKGSEIIIDMTADSIFGEHKENLRLKNIKLFPIVDKAIGDIEVTIEHEGRSIFRKGEKTYIFNNPGSTKSFHRWYTNLDLSNGNISHSEESEEGLRTIETLLGSNIRLSTLQAMPSARGFYKVKLHSFGSEVNLRELKIDFEVTFQD